jgi:hypothetical protein
MQEVVEAVDESILPNPAWVTGSQPAQMVSSDTILRLSWSRNAPWVRRPHATVFACSMGMEG